MRGFESQSGDLDYKEYLDKKGDFGVEDSLEQQPPEEIELSFNAAEFKHLSEVQSIFFDNLDETINKEGLVVHDRISQFLNKLISKYGRETVANCAFYHVLALNSNIPSETERLDLEDDLIENFIKNGFRETE